MMWAAPLPTSTITAPKPSAPGAAPQRAGPVKPFAWGVCQLPNTTQNGAAAKPNSSLGVTSSTPSSMIEAAQWFCGADQLNAALPVTATGDPVVSRKRSGSPSAPHQDIAITAVSPGFEVEHHWVGQVVVVTVSGDVDALTALQLTAAIGEATVGSPAGVIVDLSQVSFLAAAGLSVLLAAHEQVTPNFSFGVVASQYAARRPITVLGLHNVLRLYPTVEDALRGPRGGCGGAV